MPTSRTERADPLTAQLAELGIVSSADLALSGHLTARLGDPEPLVRLATALTFRALRAGHVCLEVDRVEELVTIGDERSSSSAAVADVVGLPPTEAWIDRLRSSPLVRTDPAGATPLVLLDRRLYLDRYLGYELALADELRHRATRTVEPLEPDATRARLDRLFGPDDDLDRQRLAAANALTRSLTVIAGGPGTGKTYTVARIIALLHEEAAAAGQPLRVAVAAPTGKAAARLERSLGEALEALTLAPAVRAALEGTTAGTIHRLLGVRGEQHTRFRHDATQPIPADVVIVDEASMISLPLMAKLVDAVAADARLILLGDRDQLASVEAGAVFGDLCGPAGSAPVLELSGEAVALVASLVGPGLGSQVQLARRPGVWDAVVRLARFHRFQADSPLGAVAAAIQAGERVAQRVRPLLAGATEAAGDDAPRSGRDHQLRWIDPVADPAGPARIRDEVVASYRRLVDRAVAHRPPEEVLAAVDDVRVLCARRHGPDGVERWNASIAEALERDVAGYRRRDRWPIGQPLLVLENDHQLRIYNGDVGVVVADPDDPGRRLVAFQAVDGTVRTVHPARLPATEPTFAATIHKSQGSQFTHAVVVLPRERSRLLTRELVYTALTRAAGRATLISAAEVLEDALERPIRRASALGPTLWPSGPAD